MNSRGGEALQGLEPAGVVVGIEEQGEVAAEFVVARVVVARDGGFLERPVHPFDLAVGPRVVRLGQAVLDAVLGAGEFEGMGAEDLAAVHGLADEWCGRGDVAGRGAVLAVVGEHGVHAARQGLLQGAQEVGGDARGGALVQLGKGERRGAVDGDEEVELALLGPDLGDVDVEVADRIGLEALAGRLVAVGFRQARDAVALEAAMQRASCGMVGCRA